MVDPEAQWPHDPLDQVQDRLLPLKQPFLHPFDPRTTHHVRTPGRDREDLTRRSTCAFALLTSSYQRMAVPEGPPETRARAAGLRSTSRVACPSRSSEARHP